jgi:hypothetical protein
MTKKLMPLPFDDLPKPGPAKLVQVEIEAITRLTAERDRMKAALLAIKQGELYRYGQRITADDPTTIHGPLTELYLAIRVGLGE